MRRMYPNTLPATLDCEHGSSVSEILIFGWVLAWFGSGVNMVWLLSTLVKISITSYLVGNRTSLSGSH